MSNSSLVSYVNITNKKTPNRNHSIDTITIHHMAGNLSLQNCAIVLKNRNASANYIIDVKGKIGMLVEEKDRSWCSCSSKNDTRAITIEVADDTGSPNWHVSNKSMNALIELCADICRRNNITALKRSTEKDDRVNHVNGCNMTVHKDFYATSCPGPYLYSQMSYIASEVNKKIQNKDPEGVNTYVENLYTYALGRHSDPVGKANWVNSLLSGTNTGEEVAHGIIFSQECINRNLSNGDFVDVLYHSLLNRSADAVGKSSWVDSLNKGTSRETVFKGFIGSPEYTAYCNSLGIIPHK